jgi:hypothetical protein
MEKSANLGLGAHGAQLRLQFSFSVGCRTQLGAGVSPDMQSCKLRATQRLHAITRQACLGKGVVLLTASCLQCSSHKTLHPSQNHKAGKNMTAGRLMLRRHGSCPAPEAVMSVQSSPGSPGCCIASAGPQRTGWLGPGPACAAWTGEARQGLPCEIRYCLLGRWSLVVG